MPFWQKKYRFTSHNSVKKTIAQPFKWLLAPVALSFNQQSAVYLRQVPNHFAGYRKRVCKKRGQW